MDDFLCVGLEENLTWLCEGRSEKFEMTKSIVGEGHARGESTCLIKEWGLEHCSGVDTLFDPRLDGDGDLGPAVG